LIRLCSLSKVGGNQPVGGPGFNKLRAASALQSPWLLHQCPMVSHDVG